MGVSDQGQKNRQRWRYGHPVVDQGPIRFPIKLEPDIILPWEVLDKGIVLTTTRVVRPVNEVFSGIAYLRMLAGHRRRFRALIKEMREETERERMKHPAPDPPPPSIPKTSKFHGNLRVVGNVRWDDIRMVNCKDCRRDLLGPSDECLRDAGPYRNRLQQSLPPKAYPTKDERWSCAECLLRSKGVLK